MFDTIKNVLIELKLWGPTIAGLNVFIPTMAMVYLFGRMLEISKENRTRNLIAFVTIFISSTLITVFKDNKLFWTIWNIYFLGCIGILFYVLVGFTLYSRVDAFFDKFAADRRERKARKLSIKEKRKNGK